MEKLSLFFRKIADIILSLVIQFLLRVFYRFFLKENAEILVENFRYLNCYRNNLEIQKEVMERCYKTYGVSVCVENFKYFPLLKDDIELQKILTRRYVEYRSLRRLMEYADAFPIMKDSSFVTAIYEESIESDPMHFLEQLDSLKLEEAYRFELEQKLLEKLLHSSDRNPYFLAQYLDSLKSIKDDAETQMQIIKATIRSRDVEDALKYLDKAKAIKGNYQVQKELLDYCLSQSIRYTFCYFNEFDALVGDHEIERSMIFDRLSDYHSILDSIVKYIYKFESLNNETDQLEIVNEILKYSDGHELLLSRFNNFKALNKNEEIQRRIIDTAITKERNYELLRSFYQFEMLKDDYELQEKIFFQCATTESISSLYQKSSDFPVIKKNPSIMDLIKISVLSLDCTDMSSDGISDDSEKKHELLVAGFEEAILNNRWANAFRFKRFSSFRDYLSKNWKKMILDLIKRREEEDFDLSKRRLCSLKWRDSFEDKRAYLRDEKRSIKFLKDILKVDRIRPSVTIQRCLNKYQSDESTYQFILKLLHSGQTIAESTIQEISNFDRFNDKIGKKHQDLILKFISSPFRGFSQLTYDYLWNLDSEKQQDDQLNLWAALSKEILSGKPLSRELRFNQFYFELVYAAYRPVEFSMDYVKEYLETEFDDSDEEKLMKHLSKWKLADKIWKIFGPDSLKYRMKLNKTFDTDLLKKIESNIASFQEKSDITGDAQERFAKILFSIAKSNSFQPKDDDQDFLIQYLINSKNSSVINTLENASKIYSEIDSFFKLSDVTRVRKILRRLEELYSDILKSSLEKEIIKLLEANEEEIQKWKERICGRLNKTSKQKIHNLKKTFSEISDIEAYARILSEIIFKSPSYKKERNYFKKQSKLTVTVDGGNTDPIKVIMSKSKESGLGRAGAGLCTANDWRTFKSKDFLQMMLIDEKNISIVGNVQLHVFDSGKKILARLNPTEKYLSQGVNQKLLASEMIRVCHEFADANKMKLYLPSQEEWHQLTNRHNTDFHETLEKFFGKREKHKVVIARNRETETERVYVCKRNIN